VLHGALKDLEEYFYSGGRSLVLTATVAAEREVGDIAWIAARSPIHLIVTTGHMVAKRSRAERSVEQMAAAMVEAVTVGSGGTPVRAGVIMAESSENENLPVEDRVLRAAAWTQRETGAPIAIQAQRETTVLEQLAVLQEEGADVDRVIVGWSSSRLDEMYLGYVLESGAYVSFDELTSPDRRENSAELVERLVGSGYGNQILFSATVGNAAPQPTHRGVPRWVTMIEEMPLMLMEQGMEAEVVRQLLVENPARALTTRPPSRHIP
jgi:phosphotriesterase-related protein